VAHTYMQLQAISYMVRRQGQGCSAMATRLMTYLITTIKSKCSIGLHGCEISSPETSDTYLSNTCNQQIKQKMG